MTASGSRGARAGGIPSSFLGVWAGLGNSFENEGRYFWHAVDGCEVARTCPIFTNLQFCHACITIRVVMA